MQSHHRRYEARKAILNSRLEELFGLCEEKCELTFVDLFERFDAKCVAEQISLIDSVWLRWIPKSELLLCDVLSSSSVEQSAPNWYRMIKSFNNLSQWVVSSVLSASMASTRAQYIVYFLKIADYLQNVLANFNASYAIISALSDASVDRLKQSWSRISEEYLQLWQKLQAFWSISHNFRTYREELQRTIAAPPAIPYCGLLSRDLFVVEENNRSNFVASPNGGADHVNVDKLRLLWDKMEGFTKLQQSAEYFKVEENKAVQNFILCLGTENGLLFLDPSTYKKVSLSLEKKE